MIVIQLKGGLGNQMFQYAIGRSLSLSYNKKLYLDLNFLLDKQYWDQFIFRDYELDIFNINCNLNGNKKVTKFYPESYFNTIRQIKEKYYNALGYKVIDETLIQNEHIKSHISKSNYLIGYWQSEQFFKEHADQIVKDFSFKANKPANDAIAQQIKASNSVGIHIRRGDYISNPQTQSLHGICTLGYYKEAIYQIIKKESEAEFYFFSDEPEWVTANFKVPYRHFIINWNKGKDSYEDMRLMSLCKHNIIANSSFSWWGAWLNQNPDKTIIAPAQWFANKEMNEQSKYITPDTWIRI